MVAESKPFAAEYSTTSGDGALTLAGRVGNYMSFVDADIPSGSLLPLAIRDVSGGITAAWEIGDYLYEVDGATRTITAVTIDGSSNGGEKVSWSGNAKRIALVGPPVMRIRDDRLTIVGAADPTKQAGLDVSAVTAGQRRELKLADRDIDMALLVSGEYEQALSEGQRAQARSNIHVASAIEVKSGNYTAAPGDRGKMLVFSAAATLSLTAAETLTGDWPIYVRNEATGDVVIDPDGAEQVDGKATVRVPPGYTVTVWCDGTAFRTDLPKTIQRVYDLAGLGTLEYYVEDDILEEQIDLVGVVISANGNIQSRVSLDGSTYPAGGSDYLRSYIGNGAGTSFAGLANFNAGFLWELNANSGTSVMASIIYDPGDAGRRAICSLSGSSYHFSNGRSTFVMAGETVSNGRWWGVRIYTTSGTFTAGKVVRRSIRS